MEINNGAVQNLHTVAQEPEKETTESTTATTDTAKTEELTEEQKRKAHEEAEAKRKAEWEAKKAAREEEEMLKWEEALCVSEDELVENAANLVVSSTELITRRNMKICVTDVIKEKALHDPAFAAQVVHPRKSMTNCFRYITRKASEFLKKEMQDNGEKLERNQMYGGDVPDDICYKWAIEYFTDMKAPEDKGEDEEDFVPKPYKPSIVNKPKKSAPKKKEPEKPKVEEKPEEPAQLSIL